MWFVDYRTHLLIVSVDNSLHLCCLHSTLKWSDRVLQNVSKTSWLPQNVVKSLQDNSVTFILLIISGESVVFLSALIGRASVLGQKGELPPGNLIGCCS